MLDRLVLCIGWEYNPQTEQNLVREFKELVFRFCDSPYVDQHTLVETMEQLQDIFYEYKNEFAEEIPDDELLDYMEEAFNGICQGAIEFMEDTILEVIARRSEEENE